MYLDVRCTMSYIPVHLQVCSCSTGSLLGLRVCTCIYIVYTMMYLYTCTMYIVHRINIYTGILAELLSWSTSSEAAENPIQKFLFKYRSRPGYRPEHTLFPRVMLRTNKSVGMHLPFQDGWQRPVSSLNRVPHGHWRSVAALSGVISSWP